MLAQALTLVGYNAKSVRELFGQGTKDPMLIQWLGFQGGIWITADERAKRKHAEEIRRASIHLVWVRRPRNLRFSKKDQLLLLLWVVDPILEQIAKAKGPVQFLAFYRGERPRWKRL